MIVLKQVCGQFESKLHFLHTAKSDLNLWLENKHEVVNPICRGEPDVVIQTDDSMKGLEIIILVVFVEFFSSIKVLISPG